MDKINTTSRKERNEFFPQRLKIARANLHHTQEAMAETLSVSANTYKSWERIYDGKEPSLTTVVTLSKALHVSTDYLLGRDTEQNRPLKDVAKAIGVSQQAAHILTNYAASEYCELGRNLPLNGIVLDPCFTTFLSDLLLFKYEVENLMLDPLRDTEPPTKYPMLDPCQDSEIPVKDLMQKTLTGGTYIEYRKDQLVNSFRRIIERITNYEEAMRIYDEAVTADNINRMKAKIAGRPHGKEEQ